MPFKVLAFGASTSRQSINKKFARYVADLFQTKGAQVQLIDLNDFEMPIFSVDRESEIPSQALKMANLFDESNLIIISLAEHNGSYSAAFKNIFDWMSRIPNRTVFNDKNVLLLSTSPGARGGSTVLETAKSRFPFNGAKVVGAFSLPSFFENFDEAKGITNPELKTRLNDLVQGIGL